MIKYIYWIMAQKLIFNEILCFSSLTANLLIIFVLLQNTANHFHETSKTFKYLPMEIQKHSFSWISIYIHN